MKAVLVVVLNVIVGFIYLAALWAVANILTVFALNGLRAWAVKLHQKYGDLGQKTARVIKMGAA